MSGISSVKVYLLCACISLVTMFFYPETRVEYKVVDKLESNQLNEEALFIQEISLNLESKLGKLKKKDDITYAYVGEDWIQVMQNPMSSSLVKDSIPFGQPVALMKTEFGWSEVQTRQGVRGWIQSKLLVDSKSDEMGNLLSSRYYDRATSVVGLVDEAKKQLGKPYVWGSTGPESFDCSGFVQYVYKKFGIQLPRVSSDQALVGNKVNFNELMPGDLVFFDTRGDVDGNVSHVGIYVSEGEFIHASSGKANMQVTLSNFESEYYKGRFLFGRRVY